jgi:hypothetical protein
MWSAPWGGQGVARCTRVAWLRECRGPFIHMTPRARCVRVWELSAATAGGPVLAPSRLCAVPVAGNLESQGVAAGECMRFRDRQSLKA